MVLPVHKLHLPGFGQPLGYAMMRISLFIAWP